LAGKFALFWVRRGKLVMGKSDNSARALETGSRA